MVARARRSVVRFSFLAAVSVAILLRRRARQHLVSRRHRPGLDRHRIRPAAPRQDRDFCDDGDDRRGQPAAHDAAPRPGYRRRAAPPPARAALAHLRRNALVEAGLGLVRSRHRRGSRHSAAGSPHRAGLAAAVPARAGRAGEPDEGAAGDPERAGRRLRRRRRRYRRRRALSRDDGGLGRPRAVPSLGVARPRGRRSNRPTRRASSPPPSLTPPPRSRAARVSMPRIARCATAPTARATAPPPRR